VIAAAIAFAACCPARAGQYQWPPLWEMTFFTYTYPQYLQVNTLGTFSVLDKVVGGTYYGDHDNYNDPSADSDTVHGSWTFPSNTPLDSSGSPLQTPVITRSNTLCSHTSVPTSFQCKWSTTGSKSVSAVLDDDGRFGSQSKDQVGAPSTRTQTMTVVVVSTDIDTDSNNDGTIDSTDDPIEMDSPGRIVEMGGRAKVDLSYAPSTGVTNCRLKLYTVSGPGEVTMWDSETGGSQIANGTVYTINSTTTIPTQVWMQGAVLGDTVVGWAFLPPTGNDDEVLRDDVRFKVELPPTPPLTVTVDQVPGQQDPTDFPFITYLVTFSRLVVDFSSGPLRIASTLDGSTSVVSILPTCDGVSFYVGIGINSATHSGTISLYVAAGLVHDAAGYANLASTSTDNQVTYDPPFTVLVTSPCLTTGDIAPFITWSSTLPFDSYQVQLSDVSDPPQDVWDSGVSEGSIGCAQVTHLLTNGATYSVKVQVGQSSWISDWSPPSVFTLNFTEPPLPSFIPQGGE